MSVGLFIEPSSATVEPMTCVAGSISLSEKCTIGVQV